MLPIGASVGEPLGTYVYASPQTLQDALRSAGVGDPAGVLASGYSVVFVKLQPGVDRARVLGLIRALPGVATVTDSRSLYDLVQSYLGFFYVFIGFMLLFGGIMALALIFNTVSVNLAERSTELASMRANGMSRQLIARLVTAENLILTAVGVVPGLIVGTWAAAQVPGHLHERPVPLHAPHEAEHLRVRDSGDVRIYGTVLAAWNPRRWARRHRPRGARTLDLSCPQRGAAAPTTWCPICRPNT